MQTYGNWKDIHIMHESCMKAINFIILKIQSEIWIEADVKPCHGGIGGRDSNGMELLWVISNDVN